MQFDYNWLTPDNWDTTLYFNKATAIITVNNLLYQKRPDDQQTDANLTFTWNDGALMNVGPSYEVSSGQASKLYLAQGQTVSYFMGFTPNTIQDPAEGVAPVSSYGSFGISVTANNTDNNPQELQWIQRPASVPLYVTPVYTINISPDPKNPALLMTLVGFAGANWATGP
ncbi:MAG: hypothetical protein AAF198_10675 [Pseudomonadota bacterium]